MPRGLASIADKLDLATRALGQVVGASLFLTRLTFAERTVRIRPVSSVISTSSPVIATTVKRPGYDIVTTTSPTFNMPRSAKLEGERKAPLPRMPLLVLHADEKLTGLCAQWRIERQLPAQLLGSRVALRQPKHRPWLW